MYLLSDRIADELIRHAVDRAEAARKAASSRGLRGRENAATRKILRERADQYERFISGLNTGEGVTRQSATERNT